MTAALWKSAQVLRNDPPVTPRGATECVSVRFEYDAAATAGGSAALEAGDTIEMGYLPAGCVVVDAILDADDLDTDGTPAITLNAGLVAGTPGDTNLTNRDVGTELFSGSTVGQAGGVDRMALKTGPRIAVDMTNDRMIGVEVAVAPDAGTATGKIGLTLSYRSAVHGT